MSIAWRVALIGSLFLLTAGIAGACAVPTQPIPPLATTTTTQLPLTIGTGASDPQAFANAYSFKGSAIMGSPVAPVEHIGPVCMQRFASQSYGENVIEEPSCAGTAYNIIGEVWGYAGSKGVGELGHPVMESHRWNNAGWAQDFDGGAMTYTVVARGDVAKQVHGVRSGFLNYWMNHGDVAGYLHWPLSDEYAFGAGTRQDFEGGSIIWDQPGGVRPYSPSPPPSPTGSREQRAANFAWAEFNSPNPAWSDQLGKCWSGWCEQFVEVAYGTIGYFHGGATEHYQWQLGQGRIHTDTNPPLGKVVFYDDHVGISMGDGTVVSTQGYVGSCMKVWHHAVTGFLTNAYLGWADPPPDWPGR